MTILVQVPQYEALFLYGLQDEHGVSAVAPDAQGSQQACTVRHTTRGTHRVLVTQTWRGTHFVRVTVRVSHT